MLHILKQFILDNLSSRTRQRGFTLIEMMVVIVIIGIVAATSVSVFQSQKNSKSVEIVAKEIRNKMMQAHAESMSPPSDKKGLKSVNITSSCGVPPCQFYKEFYPTELPKSYYIPPKNVSVEMDPINFAFIADNGSQMGQITTPDNPVFTIKNKDNTIKYQVEIDKMTGNVTLKKI